MRIAVMGSGGVGGYFGGKLAAAGYDVTFIARGEHLEAMRADGLMVESVGGDFVVFPAQATDDPGTVGPVDLVIFAVKSWQLEEAAELARPLFAGGAESGGSERGTHEPGGSESGAYEPGAPVDAVDESDGTVALPLLNGVENTDILARHYGEDRVLGGLCRVLSFIDAPGRIRHVGLDPIVVLGEMDDRRTERVERIHRTFVDAGIRTEIPDDIQVAIWRKFLLISTWSGIGAVTRVSIGRWRSEEGIRSMAEDALREVVAVGRARGVDLPEDHVETAMGAFDAAPPEGTASMQRDVVAGRPSELEAQSGAVVRLGAEVGVTTPVHGFLYHSLLPQERLARERAGS